MKFTKPDIFMVIMPFLMVAINLISANQESLQHQKQHNHHHHHHHLRHHYRSNSSTEHPSSITTDRVTTIHRNNSSHHQQIKTTSTSVNAKQKLATPYLSMNSDHRRNNGNYLDHDSKRKNLQGQIKWKTRRINGEEGEVEVIDTGNQYPEETPSRFEPRRKPAQRPTHSERRICAHHRIFHVPYKTTEYYDQEVTRRIAEPCHNGVNGQQTCFGYRIVKEPAYRNIIKTHPIKQIVYTCCNGWEKASNDSQGCNKPICKQPCQNGGVCTKPDTCKCPTGVTGQYCETDINECEEEKPCDQYCYNTVGSYYCNCRDGFHLHKDMHSCKKIGRSIDDAFETRDIESNDIGDDDGDDLRERLELVEETLRNERNFVTNQQLDEKLTAALESVNKIAMRVDSLEHQKQYISQLTDKINSHDAETRRMKTIVELLYRCRNQNSKNCR